MGRLHNVACVVAASSGALNFTLAFFYGLISQRIISKLDIPFSDGEAYLRVLDQIDMAMAPHIWMSDLSMLLGIICLVAVGTATFTIRLKPRAYCVECGAKIEA